MKLKTNGKDSQRIPYRAQAPAGQTPISVTNFDFRRIAHGLNRGYAVWN